MTEAEHVGQKHRATSTNIVVPDARTTMSTNGDVSSKADVQSNSRHAFDAIEEAIRELAYFKWEAAGSPEGNGVDYWLEAERAVHAVHGIQPGQPHTPHINFPST